MARNHHVSPSDLKKSHAHWQCAPAHAFTVTSRAEAPFMDLYANRNVTT
eukprot:CAMPEP_0179261846 /NCGR_PEP_ID=MMETSP0797-20121207/27068_1 /TAXON_ID=47934 /ORGANISM="Dinophysis acuminata, Strain DAEP01" /LENGTH=48 /DNA_ID= /DNA_START= /DNA_END= /DNA_ORIENTATION=